MFNTLYQDFTYTPGFTRISTPLSDVLTHKKGGVSGFRTPSSGLLVGAEGRNYYEVTPLTGVIFGGEKIHF
jgi:hypothetical protein